MTVSYSHTQHQPTAVVPVVGVIAVVGVAVAFAADVAVGMIVTAIVVAVAILLAMFSAMTVEVDGEVITIRYRWGWPRRRIERARISSQARVRNRWYHGWGIRWIRRGELWNVWGLDAVELELVQDATGADDQPDRQRRFRIGTDDLEGLKRALRT